MSNASAWAINEIRRKTNLILGRQTVGRGRCAAEVPCQELTVECECRECECRECECSNSVILRTEHNIFMTQIVACFMGDNHIIEEPLIVKPPSLQSQGTSLLNATMSEPCFRWNGVTTWLFQLPAKNKIHSYSEQEQIRRIKDKTSQRRA